MLLIINYNFSYIEKQVVRYINEWQSSSKIDINIFILLSNLLFFSSITPRSAFKARYVLSSIMIHCFALVS